MARFSGKDTETYTEILAQVCLSYSIATNKALTKEILISGSDLNPKIVASVKRYMITQSSVNLTNKSFTSGFVEYIKGDVSKGLNWVDAQGRNMMEVKKRFKISARGKVIMPQAGKRHGMIKRTNSQIRKQRGTTVMSKQDGKIVKSYMPYSLRG